MDILSTLKGIIILDADGVRSLSRSFDGKTSTAEFEKKLFIKTKSRKIKDDVLVVDNFLVVHRFVTDLHLYVIGGKNENPLVLDTFLNCLVEVIMSLLNKNAERQSIFDHLTQVTIALDEMCDNGLVLETDSNLVLQRVTLKDDIVEQSMARKIQSATEHIKFPWVR